MGRWSQRQHRGGGGPPGRTAPAPALQLTGSDTLEWEWELPNPDHWTFETSNDGITEWELDHQSPGTDRAYMPPDLDFFWRLAGRSATGQLVTGYSNTVNGQP
jgi:hypothetical protein